MRKNRSRPGDYLVQCDRTGFTVWASECRREWNGLFVRKQSWEPRHPQEFVRGVPDDQSVPIARPQNISYGDITTTLSGDELAGQTTLSVTSTAGVAAGNSIKVNLDNNETFLSTVSSIGSGTVTISASLPSKASSGNLVRIYNNTASL